MKLRAPLRRFMAEPLDDVAVERIWRGTRDRRRAHARARVRSYTLAIAAALLVTIGFAWRGRPVAPGPLRLDGGDAIVAISALERARAVRFDDGSGVELAMGATLTPTQTSSTVFAASLERGEATFDVVPGGPRRWIIDAGTATVEVLGTRFVVERRPELVRVRVERGRVRVKSREGSTELGAGEMVDVRSEMPAAAAAVASGEPSAPPPREAAVAVPARALPDAPRPARASWRELARAGDHARAYETLGRAGVSEAVPRASIEELLALADVARLSGHPAEAVAPLRRVVEEGGADAGALAAFTLGRLELDTLRHPPQAAEAFARALALGLPSSLVEDAHVRLVEARARAGDRAGARAAREAYLRAFPGGSRADSMERWLDER